MTPKHDYATVLAELEKLNAKATPGTWSADPDPYDEYIWGPKMEMIVTMRGEGDCLPIQANRDLIIALRNNVPLLMKALADAQRAQSVVLDLATEQRRNEKVIADLQYQTEELQKQRNLALQSLRLLQHDYDCGLPSVIREAGLAAANETIDVLIHENDDLKVQVKTLSETLEIARAVHQRDDCSSCGEELSPGDAVCPKAHRPCGHHCNHSWSQDRCCWCGKEWGD